MFQQIRRQNLPALCGKKMVPLKPQLWPQLCGGNYQQVNEFTCKIQLFTSNCLYQKIKEQIDHPKNKKVKKEQQAEGEKQNVSELDTLLVSKSGRKSIQGYVIRQQVFSKFILMGLDIFIQIINSCILYSRILSNVFIEDLNRIQQLLYISIFILIQLWVEQRSKVCSSILSQEEQQKTRRRDIVQIGREFKLLIKQLRRWEKPFRNLILERILEWRRLFLQPTHNTLMKVIESLVYILTLSEVEICCFEGIIAGIKSFDLVFVFKNYERQVLRIESVDMKDQEEVKNLVGQHIPGYVQEGDWTNILIESKEGEDDDPLI
ncbi:unnamed protein product [Paramecium octaurelia]|uniref:FACT complex subunit n=1 Tax=Paramecium octaurelia TaxID=43137 RepID=A0A8S1WXU2_PAROT|nr:unnamed protein product [Paramecium octaurelia]